MVIVGTFKAIENCVGPESLPISRSDSLINESNSLNDPEKICVLGATLFIFFISGISFGVALMIIWMSSSIDKFLQRRA